MENKQLMMGNEAIARGLVESGCAMATSYPGTPASEILSSVAALEREFRTGMHVQWAVNEKVALEIAYAGCQAGLRTAVSMKQVGLNVALDPLMSAAYMGTKGGFIVISADDPGPHSSQTEQDSRLMAMAARIPVLDPDSPRQAREMIEPAFRISEAFGIPVMLRPTTRVCHARQDVASGVIVDLKRRPAFEKDPARWAATPKFRLKLHGDLERKLSEIAAHAPTAPVKLNAGPKRRARAVVASGVAAAHLKEIASDPDLTDRFDLYQVLQPFPLHAEFIEEMGRYDAVLVIEETEPVIEMQLADRNRVQGKLFGPVPRVGELLPEGIESIVKGFCKMPSNLRTAPAGGRRPTLCAGCPHRASFFAIRKAAPHGIYTGDIGCYTLGLNLGAVDTVLCMGAAISQAAGFYHAYKHTEKPPDIVAAIGDSTFFHAGVPALIDAKVQNAGFVLMILDNRTTAMTGGQPTPAASFGATGNPLSPVAIEPLVNGCGVEFCRTVDPYQVNETIEALKQALEFCRTRGPAVVVARRSCLLERGPEAKAERIGIPVIVSDACDGCGYCIKHFECPALVMSGNRVSIDPAVCTQCGVCLNVCPKNCICPA